MTDYRDPLYRDQSRRHAAVDAAGLLAPMLAGHDLGLLSEAGLADVLVSEISAPMHAASFDEWWTRTSSLAGPLAKMLASLPADQKQALRARLLEAVRAYETPAGLEFPGVSLLATGHR